MKAQQVRVAIIAILDSYERSVRHYIAKVEPDRPATANAIWDAVWQFRVDVMSAHDQLTMRLNAAKYARDEEDVVVSHPLLPAKETAHV